MKCGTRRRTAPLPTGPTVHVGDRVTMISRPDLAGIVTQVRPLTAGQLVDVLWLDGSSQPLHSSALLLANF